MRRAMVWALVGVIGVALAACEVRAGDVGPLWRRGSPAPCVPAPPCYPQAVPSPYYPPGTVPGTVPGTIPGTIPETTPPIITPETMQPQVEQPFAQPTEAGGPAARTYNENFNGDFGGIFYSRFENVTVTAPVVVGFTQKVVGTTQTVTIDTAGNKIVTNTPIIQSTPIVVQQQVTQRQVIRVPLAGRYQGVFVSDNDSPRPLDRIYFGYNFLSDVGRSFNPGLGNTDIQRQTMGFEKTILDGDASVGMRLPFVQEYGPGFGSRDVGDLTLALKYAWFNNRQTGDIISSGFWVTAPTGSGSAILADGTNAPHSWLFQPWTGFVMSFDRAYVLGISNLVVPSLGRDPTVWGNSLALGYWLYRSPADRLVTGVVPVVEAHVRTPLNQRDPNGVIFLQDQLNLTTGVHFRTSRGVISPAICVPLIGPRPWALEAMCYANWLF